MRAVLLGALGAHLIPGSLSVRTPLPTGLEEGLLSGEQAARKASLVSGPFSAAPSAYLTPRTSEILARLLEWAWANGVALIPRGAGTGMPGGNLGPEVVVEIGAGFDSVSFVEDDESRIRAGAGAVAAAVDRLARTRGRFLPFLPSSYEWARVGGMVGTNAAGARSFLHGAISRSLEAVEGIFAWGEPFRLERGAKLPPPFADLRDELAAWAGDTGSLPPWPQVRKNSSGYALDRFLPSADGVGLLAGSEGTLAVVTSVELRTAPLPTASGVAVFMAGSPEEVQAVAEVAGEVGATACEFFGRRFLELGDAGAIVPEIPAAAWAVVLVETCGSAREVRDTLDRLDTGGSPRPRLITVEPASLERLWSLRHAASPRIARTAPQGRLSTQFIEDSVVPPAALARYLVELERILADARLDAVLFGHAGDANVHANPFLDLGESDWLARARRVLFDVADLVASLGGTLSGEHGDGRLRAPLLGRIWPRAWVEAFSIVKRRLDPRGVLNPGVVIPLPGQDPFDGFTPRPRPFPP